MEVYTRTVDETKILPIFKEQTIFLGDSLMNDQQLKSLNQDGKPLLKAVDDLLYFRVVESGRSYWCVRYKLPGQKRSQINIGRYGKGEGRLSISEARIEAAKIRAIIRNGEDPILLKKRTQIASLKTVNEVAEDYLAHYCKTIENPHIPQRIYRKDIAPSIGELPISKVVAADILAIVRSIKHSQRPSISNDALQLSKKILNHGIKLGLLAFNPASVLDVADAGGKEESRERSLTEEELKIVFRVLRSRANQFTRENYLAIALLLVTLVRKSELINAPWHEFDLENRLWTIPAERTKTKKTITIPLPFAAIDWLEELKIYANGAEYVFPSRKEGAKHPHISADTLNHALAKMFGMKVDSNKKNYEDHLGKAGILHFIIHDLRRTARTIISSNGTPPHIAERCLNHKLKGVIGIYDRHDYLEERREALEKLSLIIAPLVNI